MGLFDSINISSSGLTAQRLRMDVISNNIANAQSTRSADDPNTPYQRQVAVFTPVSAQNSFSSLMQQQMQGVGQGVQASVQKDTATPFKLVYDPTHPDAVKNPASPEYGYVRMPNVDVVTEMVDMISASRGYEANVTAVNAAKGMAMKALEIGR